VAKRDDLIAAARAAAASARDSAKQEAQSARYDAEQERIRLKHPPPLYVDLGEESGDAVADTTEELDAVQAGFRQRAKDEGKRFMLATDSEYWCCICFQTRDQKEAFLTALKILQYGDKYLDGQAVANELGVTLPKADIAYNTGEKSVDKKWLEFIPKT